MKKGFPWGRIVDRHNVGPYEIVEFNPRVFENCRGTHEIDETTTNFHGYIDGEDAHESWLTLDEALAGLIVRRRLGPNHHQIAAHFIAGIAALQTT